MMRLFAIVGAACLLLVNAAMLAGGAYAKVAQQQLSTEAPHLEQTLRLSERLSPGRLARWLERQRQALEQQPLALQRHWLEQALYWQPAAAPLWQERLRLDLRERPLDNDTLLSIRMVHALAPQSPNLMLEQFMLGSRHWWRSDEQTQRLWRDALRVAIQDYNHLTRTIARNQLEFQSCELARPWLMAWCQKAHWLRKHCNEQPASVEKREARRQFCSRQGFFPS